VDKTLSKARSVDPRAASAALASERPVLVRVSCTPRASSLGRERRTSDLFSNRSATRTVDECDNSRSSDEKIVYLTAFHDSPYLSRKNLAWSASPLLLTAGGLGRNLGVERRRNELNDGGGMHLVWIEIRIINSDVPPDR